ncbi:Protein fam45a [Blomia tropicalis]|nr:Protein fam45a [Blomia tropicalis]
MKKAFERLISFHLVEKRDEEIDELGNFLWRWTYPTIENSVRNFIERRLYTKLMHSDHLASNDCDHSQEGKIVVKELADLQFSLSGLECDNGPLSISSNSNSLKKIIKLFHLDVILIYTALLLKRKIVVYHHSQSKLLEFMSALPFFVSHRIECPDDTFYPNLDLHCPEQIEHIKGQAHYIATFYDSKVEEHEDLYDMYVNLAAVEITISHKSREVFSMTKTHKEIAMALVRVAENESSNDENVINEIIKKTSELRNSLFQIARKNLNDFENESIEINMPQRISRKTLKQSILSPNLEMFFWNFAIAEGMADVDDH